MFRVRHDVYFHTDPAELDLLGQILAQLVTQGVQMSALSEKVDQILTSETAEDAEHAAALVLIAELQAQNAELGSQLTEALANDAADAQTIADKQAEIDANAADVQAQIDRLSEAFPPVVEPPVE